MSVRLNDLVLAYLASQSIVPLPNSFVIVNDGSGSPDRIGSWDADTLGAQPPMGTLNVFAPTLEIQQSAQTDYVGKIAQGIAITSTGTPALNATYALDQNTLTQIQALASDCTLGYGFPGGAGTFDYPDLTGTPHTFASADMVNLYKAMRSVIYLLQVTLAARLQGNDVSWPPLSATIS